MYKTWCNFEFSWAQLIHIDATIHNIYLFWLWQLHLWFPRCFAHYLTSGDFALIPQQVIKKWRTLSSMILIYWKTRLYACINGGQNEYTRDGISPQKSFTSPQVSLRDATWSDPAIQRCRQESGKSLMDYLRWTQDSGQRNNMSYQLKGTVVRAYPNIVVHLVHCTRA